MPMTVSAPALEVDRLEASPRERQRPPLGSGWLREPLLHFVVLGGLLFALDHVLVGRADDPHTIVVGAEVDREARATFAASRGREPNAEELEALRRVWLDNEVLYREGLELQVDKGDTAIRERVIFKALSVVDSNVQVPPADEARLRSWFEAHRAKYDEPPRYDFDEATVSGTATEASARAFAQTLNDGTPAGEASLRVFKARPRPSLVVSYGEAFAAALDQAPPKDWRALETRDGWRVIRLRAIVPAKQATFEALRAVVLQDWTDDVAAEQRTAAVRALEKKYRVKYETAK